MPSKSISYLSRNYECSSEMGCHIIGFHPPIIDSAAYTLVRASLRNLVIPVSLNMNWNVLQVLRFLPKGWQIQQIARVEIYPKWPAEVCKACLLLAWFIRIPYSERDRLLFY